MFHTNSSVQIITQLVLLYIRVYQRSTYMSME